jgi:Zn-dependent protease with chaperone function
MHEFAGPGLARACLFAVPQWKVRATLDSLDLPCVSRIADSTHHITGRAVPIAINIIATALGLFFPTLAERNLLYLLMLNELGFMIPLFISLSFGFAMLRSRLWDIDIIINRTLVYATLTAILAFIYFGLIFTLQFLFQGFFRQNNAFAIVVSTLAIAALFQPLRHRIQVIIDRRFYRRKYDAAKTLEAFSATLRNELDLNQLREQLLSVVEETMQPAHVSLWIIQPVDRRTDSLERQ